jgi:hypothetical protein
VDGRDDLHRGRMRKDVRNGRALDQAFHLGRYVIEPAKKRDRLISAHKPSENQNNNNQATHRSTRAIMYPSMIPRSMILNRYAPCVATTLRPSASISTLRISSIVPNSLRKPPSACDEMTMPKRGGLICKQRRSISRYLTGTSQALHFSQTTGLLPPYLGSKMGRFVGRPGKESWDTKMGVSSRGSRSSR